jgi:chorismate mutase
LHSPNCAVDLKNALSTVISERELDDLYQRALTYATHSYCR